uniref:Uncharacterized protein K02A2.6like [Amphimedon queenslandica] n=1 Tax=Lepeophtheirus salmonis TaxID=72036 RepID=A0A0K2V2D8_LEPSM
MKKKLLFTYRSTPISCEKYPAELLFCHSILNRLHSLLPNKSTRMKEPIRESNNVGCKKFNSCNGSQALLSRKSLLRSGLFASMVNLKPDI